MIYRRFGRTDLQMPVFSCGGMRYQHAWQDKPLAEIPEDNQRNLEATIHRAVELGINHIETARGYGTSERQLGLILPKLPRQKLIVQTKVGPEEKAEQFERNFEESLERLNLQYVDLLAIHGINDAHTLQLAIRPGGCLEAARKMQQRGLARHIGFSTHGPREIILQAIECPREGGFDYVNLHWFYIYQHNWAAIEEATRRDMGVFIISPSDKGGKLYEPTQRLVDLCQPLHPIIFNDLFCLSHPQVHTLSIGASRPTDFDLHVQTLPHLDKAELVLPPILGRLAKALADVVEPDLRNPFAMGLPAPEQTPGGINLPIILWLRNLILAYDMHGYGQMRYNLLGNGGHWFPGQNAGKVDEVDLSAIAASSGLGERLARYLRQTHEILAAAPAKRLSQS